MAGTLAVSPSAYAVQGHALKSSFNGTGATAGAFVDLGSIAVHQQSGDIYAVDRAQGVIDKFDASGTPTNFSALGSTSIDVEGTCPGFQFPPYPSAIEPGGELVGGFYHGRDDIAVSSAGPTDGNIYVGTDSVDPYLAPPGTSPGICAYNSAGTFLWKDTEVAATGFSVDQFGHLWAVAYEQTFELANSGSPPEILSFFPWAGDRIAIDSSAACPAEVGAPLSPCIYIGTRLFTLTGNRYTIQQNGGPVTVDPTNNHFYVANGEGFHEYGVAGSPLLSGGGEDIFEAPQGIAVLASSQQVYVSDSTTNRVYIFGPVATLAAVATGPASNVRRTTAEISGNVDPDGGGTITNCHVEYGTSKSYGNSTPCNEPTPFSSSQGVTASLSGLSGGTTYHYRVFATDAAGQSRGTDQTFATPYISGLATESASDLDRTTVTLNGSLDPDGVATTFYFQWGLTTGYGNATPLAAPGQSIGSAPGTQHVSATAAGMEPETTYHYRLIGQNSEGKTIGEDRTVTTALAVKSLATTAATEVGPDAAQLNGTFNPDGFNTTYYFEWGQDTGYGHITPAPLGASAGSDPNQVTVSEEAPNLEAYTAYHYRLVASNSFGATYGSDVEFLSAPPYPPSIPATEVAELTNRSVDLRAQIVPGFGPAVYRFQYGLTNSYSSRTPLSDPIGSDNALHLVSEPITGLQPGTTYHYRAVAINFTTSALSPDHTFTTADAPRIDFLSPAEVGQTSVTLRAQISPSGAATTYHFEYGKGPSFESSTAESSVGTDTSTHAVQVQVGSLAPETSYHFSVVATNMYGSVKSSGLSFTTLPAGPKSPPKPKKCKRGLVRRHGKCKKRSHRAQGQKRQVSPPANRDMAHRANYGMGR